MGVWGEKNRRANIEILPADDFDWYLKKSTRVVAFVFLTAEAERVLRPQGDGGTKTSDESNDAKEHAEWAHEGGLAANDCRTDAEDAKSKARKANGATGEVHVIE